MKLSKNIFKVTEENIKFFHYLLENPNFFISDLCEKFRLGRSNLTNHLAMWERQGYIVKERLDPKLGGKRYSYSLSEKAIEKLKTLKDLANKFGD